MKTALMMQMPGNQPRRSHPAKRLGCARISAGKGMIAGLTILCWVLQVSYAQDTRPRYSSPQYPDQVWTVPQDTVISVRMDGNLNSATSRVGDRFTATVTAPVYVDGKPVIPAGAIVEGRVTEVTRARRPSKSGTIGIDFDSLVLPDGSRLPLSGALTSSDPATRKRIDQESRVSAEPNHRKAVFIGGGGAIGAVLGAATGGGVGAVVGGVSGAAAGAVGVMLSKGDEAQVYSGAPFGVQLRQALTIRAGAPGEGGPPAREPEEREAARDNPPPSMSPADRPIPDRAETGGRPPDNPDARRADPPPPAADAGGEAPASTAADAPLSSPEMLSRAQSVLKDQGYYEGAVDGVMNPRTATALKAYQREHNIPETGDLDPQTAKSLGIIGSGNPQPAAERGPSGPPVERRGAGERTMAKVLTAAAERTPDGAIHVSITTQANTGGWRWFGESVVNGDTLEVYARAEPPQGIATQVISRGRIELTVRDNVRYVSRVVIHSASADQTIALGGRAAAQSPERPDYRDRPDSGGNPSRDASYPRDGSTTRDASINRDASTGSGIQRQAEELLLEYERIYGMRLSGSKIEIDNQTQYREPEIHLLFALDGFANAAQLYNRLSASLQDPQSQRGAALSLSRQARRTDIVVASAATRTPRSIAYKWDSVRQNVLRLMQTYGINTAELDN